jgi:hypothetical protein
MSLFSTMQGLIPGQKGMTEPELDNEDYDDFVGEDEWEDGLAIDTIKAKHPDHWVVVKVINFTAQTLADVKEWCINNCSHPYEHVGWDSGCSYTVGVIFSNHTDAVMFKLVWGS